MEFAPVKKNPVSKLEKLYAVLTLFILARPLWRQMIVGGFDIQFFLVMILYLVPLWFAFNKLGHFTWIASRDKLLLFLIFLALISVIWSTDPSATIKSAIILLGGTFLGIYLAMRYSLREQMQVFLWTLIVIEILSLIVIMAAPSLGVQAAGGKPVWVGIYDHKNGLGRYMAINAILSWIMLKDSKKKWLLWTNFFLSVFLVIMSSSATSLIVMLVTICLLPIFQVWRWRNARALPGLLILGILSTSILVVFLTDQEYAGLDYFFVALGRNPSYNTLQVRMALWNIVVEKAQQRPLFGYGYGNTSVYSTLDSVALARSVWTPEQSHNGFLEIFMQLGLVGLAAMVLHIILGFRRGFILARLTKANEALWVIAYLIILLLFNLTYSIYLGQLTMPWTIYVALSLSVCFQLKKIGDMSGSEEKLP